MMMMLLTILMRIFPPSHSLFPVYLSNPYTVRFLFVHFAHYAKAFCNSNHNNKSYDRNDNSCMALYFTSMVVMMIILSCTIFLWLMTYT